MTSGWEGLGGPVRVEYANLSDIDPTLESCCEREEVAARKNAALQRTLQRFDVVEQRRRKNIVKTPDFDGCRCCYDPNSDGGEYPALTEFRLAQERDNGEGVLENGYISTSGSWEGKEEREEEDGEASSEDEFDYLLDEDLPGKSEELKTLEEMRRAELQLQLLQREVAIQHGYGVHRQMYPNRVLKAAHSAVVAVVHLVDPDSIASASLDWFLAGRLAPKFPGTKFMRSNGRSTLLMDAEFASKVLPHLQPDRDMPALIVFRDGQVTCVCQSLRGLCDHYSGQIVTSVVEDWLENANALITNYPALEEMCRIRPEEEALMDYIAKQKPKEDFFECGMLGCEKSFPHKHVGEANEKQDGLVVSESEVVEA